MDSTVSTDSDGKDRFTPIGLAARLCNAVSGFVLRRTALWRDIRSFGNWLESDGAMAAGELHENTVLIELGRDEDEVLVKAGLRKYTDSPGDYDRLWRFLRSIGITRLDLDRRLERNQVVDIMTLLHTYRRRLGGRRPDEAAHGGVVGSLLSENGLHIACTRTSIRSETLVITYTYCTLTFSRLMRWFERKHENFHDHRALFYAAPRFAVLVGVIAISPSVVYLFIRGDWSQFAVSAFVDLLLAGMVYVFFMVAGSVEYDNEEKDYRLQKAYYEVKSYADQIKADLHRAQVIQRKFLPDLAKGRLSENIKWAVSFVPVEEVGGDYYDVQALDEDRIAVLFCDVSGHGMAAAFITCILKTTFASWADNDMTLPEFMSVLNVTLCRLIPAGNFAAVFAGVYDCSTGEFCYVNGGHHPQPWHIALADAEPISVITGGSTLLMGVEEDTDIKMSRLSLAPGDIVLFVSDGMVENRNAEGVLYGLERLEDFLGTKRGAPVDELVASILSEWRAFSEGTKQADDGTILAFQIKR